eukprot:7707776-Pyramimonas_sp.AAC.1
MFGQKRDQELREKVLAEELRAIEEEERFECEENERLAKEEAEMNTVDPNNTEEAEITAPLDGAGERARLSLQYEGVNSEMLDSPSICQRITTMKI